MHADVVQVHPALILTVEPPDVGPGPVGLEHDGDAVQLLMTRMEDVSRHRRPAQTVAAQWRSNAAVRSAAID